MFNLFKFVAFLFSTIIFISLFNHGTASPLPQVYPPNHAGPNQSGSQHAGPPSNTSPTNTHQGPPSNTHNDSHVSDTANRFSLGSSTTFYWRLWFWSSRLLRGIRTLWTTATTTTSPSAVLPSAVLPTAATTTSTILLALIQINNSSRNHI